MKPKLSVVQQVMRSQGIGGSLVVMEITIIDDGGVECFRVFLYYVVGFFRDHTSWASVLGVYWHADERDSPPLSGSLTIMVQIVDDLGEVLLRFFVQVGDSDACCEDRVIRMLGRQISGGL